MAFNSNVFQSKFADSIKALRGAEAITRSELLALSRSTLEALHSPDNPINGDIKFVNEVISVLTPVNKKVACLFFRAFTGFQFDGVAMQFTKKNKKVYDDVQALAGDFLDDPLNNIWTWAERNIEVEVKAFDLQKSVDSLMKRATKDLEGEALTVQHLNVLKAVLDAGISADTLIEFMNTIGLVEE
jgi:hypothetical protein